MASTANGTALPDVIDPAGLQATTHFLISFEAHLRDPKENPEPLIYPLLDHATFGSFRAVFAVPTETALMIGVSLGSSEMELIRPLDYVALRLGLAFGLEVTDHMLFEAFGFERWAFRAAAIEHFEKVATLYPLAVPREVYANMLDLAFGLIDRVHGDADEGLFPDNRIQAAEGHAYPRTLRIDGELFADSRAVAEDLGVEHAVLLRDIAAEEDGKPSALFQDYTDDDFGATGTRLAISADGFAYLSMLYGEVSR